MSDTTFLVVAGVVLVVIVLLASSPGERKARKSKWNTRRPK